MRFLCKELKFSSLEETIFSLPCECVSCSYDATSASAIILNQFNQSQKRNKNLLWLVFYVLKKNFPSGNLCLSRTATAKKFDRKACVIMHVQSNVFLVRPVACLIFGLC